jgi:Uma2 family endonuclease
MERRISTSEYFRMPETNRPAELVYGFVHEPPAPLYGHQKCVGQLFYALKVHVEEQKSGDVCVSPIDVVLDEAAGLVVQPDVIFVANERSAIIRNQIVGAPDLVVEVLSPGTEYRDRTIKLAWYRRYGVRECWIANPHARTIDVVDCGTGTTQSFAGDHAIRSQVLPAFDVSADACFT